MKKKKDIDDEEVDAFADEVVEKKMNELNREEEIDDDFDFDEFLKAELEDEENSEEQEELGENDNLENMFEEEGDEFEEMNDWMAEKKKKKGLKSKKIAKPKGSAKKKKAIHKRVK